MTGSSAYAAAEAFGWKHGFDKKFKGARAFYGLIAISTLLGTTMNFSGFNPIRTLFWTAVINGLLAPPLLLLIISISNNPKIMGGGNQQRPCEYRPMGNNAGYDGCGSGARCDLVTLSPFPLRHVKGSGYRRSASGPTDARTSSDYCKIWIANKFGCTDLTSLAPSRVLRSGMNKIKIGGDKRVLRKIRKEMAKPRLSKSVRTFATIDSSKTRRPNLVL